METTTALTILATILPAIGTVVVSVFGGLLNRSVRMLDEKLGEIDRKLDGQGDRLTRLEVRVDALERQLQQQPRSARR